MKKILLVFCITLLGSLFLAACSMDKGERGKEIDKVVVTKFEKESNQGVSVYKIRIKNNSNYILVQNTVYFYFDLKDNKEKKGDVFKAEAVGNKLNIKPGEELDLSVTIPDKNNGLQMELLDIENPHLEMKGYIKDFSEDNRFHKTLSIDDLKK
jgi:hypothetical protein